MSQQLQQQQQLEHLAARRWRVALSLTAVMLIGYFGFILLVAFDKPLMGTLVAGGRVSLGVLVGAGVIMLAPLLTGIYVRWCNVHYDAAVAALSAQRDRLPVPMPAPLPPAPDEDAAPADAQGVALTPEAQS